MKITIEPDDVLAAVEAGDLGLHDLLPAVLAWAEQQESRGYNVAPFRAHIAAAIKAADTLQWTGARQP